MRALEELGVWKQVDEHGYSYNSLGLRAPDPMGTLVAELGEMRTGGPDLPATAGMYRPDLARILMDRAVAVGAQVRLGLTPVSLVQDHDGVDVEFSDGSAGRYDLVIGADGVRSWTRKAIGIDVQTTPTGMGIWRVFTRRPESVTRTDLYYGAQLHRRVLPDRSGHPLRLRGRKGPGLVLHHARRKAVHHQGSRGCVPRAVG